MTKSMDTLDNAALKRRAGAHHADIQDEIARTYFYAAGSKKGKQKKINWKPFLPWLVAVVAIITAVSIVLFRSSIDVKVRFLGEIPSMPFDKITAVNEGGYDKGAFLVEGGEPNKDIIKNAYFIGDAKNFSMAKPDELVLCNSKGSGWANYTLELKDIVDLNKLDVRYTAKGAKGEENLVLVIVDSSNRSYRLEKDLSSVLSDKWRKYTINFARVKQALDLSDISKIKFEFGTLTAGNHPSAVISLKDVYITKTRRFKWL